MKKLSLSQSVLIAVWGLAIAIRCQNFFLPPIDAHPMRQTDTESVAYFFATVDPNPLHPQASLIRPQTNVHGYFFLEFPAYPYMLSVFYRLFGSSIVVARIFNLVLFSLSYWLIYTVTKKLFSEKIGLWSAIIYSLIPSSIFFFGHAIHPDLFAITLTLGAAYFSTTKKTAGLFMSSALFAIAVGSRPFILMALPSLLTILWLRKRMWWQHLILGVSSVSLYGFWSWWQHFFPEADHSWQLWTLQGREVLSTFEGWKFLIWRNTSGEVIGRVTTALFGVGTLFIFTDYMKKLFTTLSITSQVTQLFKILVKNPEKLPVDLKIIIFSFPWLCAVPVYWYLVPAGNAAHQYYANVFVLPIIFVSAWGANKISTLHKKILFQLVMALGITIALLYNGLRTSSYFYANLIPEHHLAIAREIELQIPLGEKIVYLATNNSVPFSLAHRQGWMLGAPNTDVAQTAAQILNMKNYGAKYAVWAKNNNDLKDLELESLQRQTIKVYESEEVVIYQL